MFIELTLAKGEPFILNVSQIVAVTVSKNIVYVYYGDMEFITVQETFDSVKSLLDLKQL